MADPTKQDSGELRQLYAIYSKSRESFLRRARKCATLTIPTLMPPEGNSASAKLPTPYQAIGARCVNSLAAKLLLALFPPNGQFFRLTLSSFDLDRIVLDEAAAQAGNSGQNVEEIAREMREKVVGETEENLARIERAVVLEYEGQPNRATDFEAFKQLITCGNVLRRHPVKKDKKPRIYRLDQYVMKRSPDGQVLDIITCEGLTAIAIPKKVCQACGIDLTNGEKRQQSYNLYTRCRRVQNNSRWEEYQELNGVEIPGSRGSYPADKNPWLPLRWSKLDGEDYGRGLVEEYLGDLISLDGLSKALLDGATAAARLLVMVRPNGTTRLEDVSGAPNGAVRAGDANEVSFLQCGKHADFQTAQAMCAVYERRISQAFLETASIQRNGERVTATEIQALAGELENTLGGIYSMLGQEYQLPLVMNIVDTMQLEKRLPPLPSIVKPVILTGIQALGRNTDLMRLDAFLKAVASLAQVVGPQEVAMRMNIGEYITRAGTSLDLDLTGLIKPEAEVQEMLATQQQAQQQQMMLEKLAPPAISAGGKILQEQAAQNMQGEVSNG